MSASDAPEQPASQDEAGPSDQPEQQSQRPPRERGGRDRYGRGRRGGRDRQGDPRGGRDRQQGDAPEGRDRQQGDAPEGRDRQSDAPEGRDRQSDAPEGRPRQPGYTEGRVRQGGSQEVRDRQTDFQGAPEVQPEPLEQPERQNEPREPRDRREGSHGGRERRDDPRGGRDRRDDSRGGGRERRDEFQSGGRDSSGPRELSIVIPLYNEEQSLRELYDDIRSSLSRINRYEIIFVDDGSTDNSARVLQGIRERDKSRIKIIRFRRNFGKSAALAAGFALAQGSVVVTMDADLQDDPAEIPTLMNEIKRGFDLVSGWKKKRKDPITKTIPSRFFNFITRLLTGIKIHDFNCGLKAYRKEVVKEVRVYGELHRYIPVLAHGLGFKIGEVPVRHRPRRFGKTKFGIGRFWKGFLDLVTVMFTTRYLQRPLHLFGFWGIVFFLLGFSIDGYLTYLKLYDGASLGNRPLFFGGILFIIVGIQFISVGLLGEMISKTRQSGEEQYSIRETWK